MLRSPTAKHLYSWEVLMCNINILPSKATMHTRISKAISIMCTETHAHRHIYRLFSSVFLHERNQCAGRCRTRGDPSSPSQIYCCFNWENMLCRNSKRTLSASSLRIVIYGLARGFFCVTGGWEGQYILPAWKLQVPWMDLYCPASFLKEPSCYAQERINKVVNLVLQELSA